MLCSVKTPGGAHHLASPAQPWPLAAPAPPATLGLVHPRLPNSGVPFSTCPAWRLSRTHSTTQNLRALLHGAFPQTLRPPSPPQALAFPPAGWCVCLSSHSPVPRGTAGRHRIPSCQVSSPGCPCRASQTNTPLCTFQYDICIFSSVQIVAKKLFPPY